MVTFSALTCFVSALSENITVVLVLLLVLVGTLYWMKTRYSGRTKAPYPPGPWGFPILGHLPLLGKDPMETMARYRERYGDIFRIRMGSFPTVVINGKDSIREALTRNLDDFAGRPKLYTAELLKQKNGAATGLSFSGFNLVWKAHRRIINNALKMFANYKNNPVEEMVNKEANKLVDVFLRYYGKPFVPTDEVLVVAGSVIYLIMFGRNQNVRNDKDFTKMIQNNLDFSDFANAGNPVDVMPWTRFILPGRVQRFLDMVGTATEITKSQCKRHQETYDSNNLRDVMDALLKASDELTPEDKALGLNCEVIMSAVTDLLGAGFETVGVSLIWAILLVVTSPSVKEKVQFEIDAHLGKFKEPCYEDRKHLPYVEAVILEIHRFASIVPFGVPHSTTRDVEFSGYFLPRDTFVIFNSNSICRDKQIWGDPDVFRPERFLTDGVVDSVKADMLLRFGAGRRRCVGEILAKVELFLIFTRVMQRCSFMKVPGETYSLRRNFGFTNRPSPYRITVKQRY